MALPALDKLVEIGRLKAEPRNDKEVERILALARTRLVDAGQNGVSRDGRFACAYGAAHAAALAALRWHGYRSEHRVTVFQCLVHTVGWSAEKWRVLDAAHKKRNLAEYEGETEFEESSIAELIKLTAGLIEEVAKLVNSKKK